MRPGRCTTRRAKSVRYFGGGDVASRGRLARAVTDGLVARPGPPASIPVRKAPDPQALLTRLPPPIAPASTTIPEVADVYATGVSPDAKAGIPVISSLVIERLHGKFTYTIPIAPSHGDVALSAGELFAANEDRLTLLYGNNGTGKTQRFASYSSTLFHRPLLVITVMRSSERVSPGSKCTSRRGGYVAYVRDADSLEGPYTAVLARSEDDSNPITWRYWGPSAPRPTSPTSCRRARARGTSSLHLVPGTR